VNKPLVERIIRLFIAVSSLCVLALIHPSAQKGDSPKVAACKEFGEVGFSRAVHREFIAAGYGNGGVGLPSLSSSFSFPELLVGFPRAHPALLALFLMRVRGR
jgi:hypothetical protein